MNELSEGKKNAKDYLKQNGDLVVLKDFLSNVELQFQELENKYQNAQKEFITCTSYFGEKLHSLSSNSFFLIFFKFIKAYKVSLYKD